MLVPDAEIPGGERVKILDFGIAKILTKYEGPGSEDFKTNTGIVLGTATYMAPEQCKGAGQVTDRADVYSLGVVMYRMCCGQVPFRADGQGEVMAMHIFSQPKPLRERDASIPEVLTSLIERMMAKDPVERPTMSAIAQELEKMSALPVIQGAPVVAISSPQPADSGNHSSSLATLSAALGQSGRMKAVPPPQRRWPAVAFIGVLIVVAGGLGAHYGLRTFVPTAATPKKVYWTLNAVPVQAQVLRKADGQVMGTTPWVEEPRPGSGRQQFVLRAAGYLDQEIELDERMSASPTVQLKPAPTATNLAAADGGSAPDGGTSPDAASPEPRTDGATAVATPPQGQGSTTTAGTTGTQPQGQGQGQGTAGGTPGAQPATNPQNPATGIGTKQPWPQRVPKIVKPRDKVLTDDDIKTLED